MTKAAELAKMGEVLTNSQIGRKNIIINGGMQISQRSTSETGLGADNGYFTLDRYTMIKGDTSAGRFTMSQSSVTDLEGFSNALKIDCTTADTSIAAGEALLLTQNIEGFNLQQIKATSTSTRAITLSFYAKSNASRAIATEFRLSNGTNRQAIKLHTIGTSWARYTFTIPAASSTQIDNDNSHEASLNFWLHAGSTYKGGTLDATLSPSNNANRAEGIGSIFASTDNTLEITGVQLEVGSQATPFEHRSFGEELALCQRYFQIISGTEDGNHYMALPAARWSSNKVFTSIPLHKIMRAEPSMTVLDKDGTSASGNAGSIMGNNNQDDYTASDMTLQQAHDGNTTISIDAGFDPNNNYAHFVYFGNGERLDFDAEL